VKWGFAWDLDDAEMVVAESINTQVLHWGTQQGNVPFSEDESCGREL
jgi:hypothetical protein